MSVREYKIDDPTTIAELRRQLVDTLLKGCPLKLEAPPVADDLSARRGGERVRSFTLSVVSIDVIPKGLQLTAQDVQTSAWATLTITDTAATITVVD